MSNRRTARTVKKAFWINPFNAAFVEGAAEKEKISQSLWLDEILDDLRKKS